MKAINSCYCGTYIYGSNVAAKTPNIQCRCAAKRNKEGVKRIINIQPGLCHSGNVESKIDSVKKWMWNDQLKLKY